MKKQRIEQCDTSEYFDKTIKPQKTGGVFGNSELNFKITYKKCMCFLIIKTLILVGVCKSRGADKNLVLM